MGDISTLNELQDAIRDYDTAKKAKAANSEKAVNDAYDIASALFDNIKSDLSEDPQLHSRISLIEKLHQAFEFHDREILDRCLEEMDTCDLSAQERQPLKTIFSHFDVSLADSEVTAAAAAPSSPTAAASASPTPASHPPPAPPQQQQQQQHTPSASASSPRTPRTPRAPPLSPALNGTSTNTIDTSIPPSPGGPMGPVTTRSARSLSFRLTGSMRRLSSAKSKKTGGAQSAGSADPASCYGGLTLTAPPPNIVTPPSSGGASHHHHHHRQSNGVVSPRSAKKQRRGGEASPTTNGAGAVTTPASPYESTPAAAASSSDAALPRKVSRQRDFRDTLNMVQFARLVAVVAEKYFKSDGSKRYQRASLTPTTFRQPSLHASLRAPAQSSSSKLRPPHHQHSLSHDNLSFRPFPQNLYPHHEVSPSSSHRSSSGRPPLTIADEQQQQHHHHTGGGGGGGSGYHSFARRQALLSAMAQGPDVPRRGSNNAVEHPHGGMNGYHQSSPHSRGSADPLAEPMPSKFLSKNPSIHGDQIDQTPPPPLHPIITANRSDSSSSSSSGSKAAAGRSPRSSRHSHHSSPASSAGAPAPADRSPPQVHFSTNHLVAPSAKPGGLPQKFFQRNPSFRDSGDERPVDTSLYSHSRHASSDSAFPSGSRSAGSSPPRGYALMDNEPALDDGVRTSSPFPVPQRAMTSPYAQRRAPQHGRDSRSSSPFPSAREASLLGGSGDQVQLELAPSSDQDYGGNPFGVHTVPMPVRTLTDTSDDDSNSSGSPLGTHTVPAPRAQRASIVPSPNASAHRRIMSAGVIGGFGIGGRLALQRDRALGRSSFLMEGDPVPPDRQGLSRSPPLDRKRGVLHARSTSSLTDHEADMHHHMGNLLQQQQQHRKRSMVSEPSSLRRRFSRALGRSHPVTSGILHGSSSPFDTPSSSSGARRESRSPMARTPRGLSVTLERDRERSPSPSPGMRIRKQASHSHLVGNNNTNNHRNGGGRIRELSPSRGRAATDAHAHAREREREWQFTNGGGGGNGPVTYSNSDSDSDSISSSISHGSRSRSYSHEYGTGGGGGSRAHSPEQHDRSRTHHRDRSESDENRIVFSRPKLTGGGNGSLLPSGRGSRGRMSRHIRSKTDVRPALTVEAPSRGAPRRGGGAHSRHISHGAGIFLGLGGAGNKRSASSMSPPPPIQRSASDFGGIIPANSGRPSFSKPMAPKQEFEKARQQARKNHQRENSMPDAEKLALHPKMFMPPTAQSLSRPKPESMTLDRRKPAAARDEYAVLKEGILLKKYNNRGRGQSRYVWLDESLLAVRWAKSDRKRHKELNSIYSDNMLCIEAGCRHAKPAESGRSLTIVGMARELYLCFPTVQSRTRWEEALSALVVRTSLKRSTAEPKERRGRTKSRDYQPLKRSRTTPVPGGGRQR